ncbi:NAD(P)/FAD-dependent oxidoreductase [Candidatus Cyanaurora vandensis]|uniref:dihydrolipoyl dehydrogenase family protein n=1 Tax=Candidatus Cyanaurora vandensis TaxID=2714958 RepID=UPI00257DF567|nr:NAD(P)/FAD-dependent oxidoreductase [Candidatus Cyanaurora vandensis]
MFDLVVLGSGAAGSTVAKACRTQGWSVALVEMRPLGGTCALRGCNPKKVLVETAQALARVRSLPGLTGEVGLDWPALMAYKRTFTGPIPPQRQAQYDELGITVYHGAARFTGATMLQVGEETITGRHILIATGSKPAPLGIPGEELVTTSDEFMELAELPKRILFIGGGYISLEFAHVARQAGCQVQVIHEGERPLEPFDPDLVDLLVQASTDLGIEIRCNTEVKRITKGAGGLIVHADEAEFNADLVVHGASRAPDIQDLDLEQAGVANDKKGIQVNAYLQSSNPQVWAAGDCAATGLPQLTPLANHQAQVVAANLLGQRRELRIEAIPSVVFTIPNLGSVGLTEQQAQKQGIVYTTRYEDASTWSSTRAVAGGVATYKLLLTEDYILGAHALGPHASEVINVLALAIQAKIKTADLKEFLFAYPTGASDLAYLL